jgi:replicative DNA helicase
LYIITLIAIVVALPQWEVSIVVMLVLIIVLVQKISTEGKIEEVEKKRVKSIDTVAEKLDIFSNKAEELKKNLNRNMFVIENRIFEIGHSQQNEMEKHYRELARKIFDVENKLNSVKKTLGAAVGSLDERVKRFEKEEEWTG